MTNESQDAPQDAGEARTRVTIRRAPKFSVFVVVGGLIGFLVTLVLTSLFPADPAVGFTASLGYFSLFGIPIGAAIAAVIALLIDRRATRSATEVIAGKLTVHAEAEPSAEDDSASSDVQDSDG